MVDVSIVKSWFLQKLKYICGRLQSMLHIRFTYSIFCTLQRSRNDCRIQSFCYMQSYLSATIHLLYKRPAKERIFHFDNVNSKAGTSITTCIRKIDCGMQQNNALKGIRDAET